MMSGWTDYLPDWSSPDALRLYNIEAAVDALTAAVNERSRVFEEFPALSFDRLTSLYTVIAMLQSRIRSLIPKFVNHTIQEGGFATTQLSYWGDLLPYWTEKDMTESLELDFLTGVSGDHEFRDRLYEQYRLVNMLRWLAVPMHSLMDESDGATYRHSWYGDHTFEGVKAAFIEGEGPHGSGGYYPYPHLVSFDFRDKVEIPYIDAGVCRFGVTWQNPYDFACGRAVYAKAVKCPPRSFDPDAHRPGAKIFLPIPPFLEENVWYDLSSQSEFSGDTVRTPILLRGDCDGYNQYVVNMERYSGIAILPSNDYHSGAFLAVQFDVPGGFTFGDWEEPE